MKKQRLCILCLASLMVMASSAFSACKLSGGADNSSDSSVEIIDNRTISINKTELTLTRGETETLTAQLSVGKGTFTWTSSNEAVATVSQDGEVCAVEVGTATITVSYEDVTATCTVTVELPDYVPVFKVSEQSIPLWIGNSYPIDGTVTFGGVEVEANVSYVSQNPSVATVDENGFVCGVDVGETTVTVTAEYFGLTEQMVVDVIVSEPIIIRSNMQTAELDSITDEVAGFSKTETLSVEVLNRNEDITDTITYNWTVSDPSIAEIEEGSNSSAILTARGIGETNVKVSFTVNGRDYENVFAVKVNRAMCEIPDMIAEDYSGQIVMSLPEGISITETPKTIMFGDNEIAFVSMNEGCIVLEKGAFGYSNYEVRIEVENYGYVSKNVVYYTKVFTQADVANFKTILAETPNGHFVLGEDLDFGGASLSGVIANFSGTLDGKGYALKNFSNALGQDGSDWVDYFIKENSGTIKNLSLRFTMAVSNTTNAALICKNSGSIENVKMDVTYAYTNDPWMPGSLVGINTGTIQNIVAVMNKTADVVCVKAGCIVGANQNGTVQNCYVVNNGVVYSSATDGIWAEGWGTKTNCTAYATMSELAIAATFSSESGWSEAWKIEESVVLFGYEEIVIEENLELTSEKKEVSLYVGETLEEGQEREATVTVALSVNGVDATSEATYTWAAENANVNVAGNGASAVITAASAGTCAVTVTAERNGKTATYTFSVTITLVEEEPETVITLTQADVANFKSILEATPDGHFVLGEDLDFGGASLSGVIANFSGTLDGKGYALKNFSNALGQDGSDWVDYFIKENSGTIKNLSLQFTMAVANTTNAALIYKNSGTIENVKMDVTYAYTNDPWMPGSLVGINTGTIQNVVAVMNKVAGVVCAKVGCIIGANQSGTVQNCYVVNNGVVYSSATDGIWAEGWGTKTNCTAYATMSELAAAAAFSSENGWSSYWGIANGEVTFGA